MHSFSFLLHILFLVPVVSTQTVAEETRSSEWQPKLPVHVQMWALRDKQEHIDDNPGVLNIMHAKQLA